MEARETLNTQPSPAVGSSNPLPHSEAQNNQRFLSLELSLGVQQVQGQGSGDKRARLSKEQIIILEAAFDQQQNPDAARRNELAELLGLIPRQVNVWFHNRRARTKSKKNETELERLKQECENSIEENRKLREELEMWKAQATAERGAFSACGLSVSVIVCPFCHQEFLIETGTGAI